MKKKNLLKSSARLIWLFGITLMMASTSFGQTQSIISQTGITPSQLNSSQLAKFNRLTASSLRENFQLVQVQNLSSSQVNGKVRLALSNLPCNDLIFTATKVEYISESNYYWYGIIDSEDEDNPCKGGFITLMAKEGEKFGAIVFDDYSYEFQDVGNGIQALSRFKLESVGENECGVNSGTPGYRSSTPSQSINTPKNDVPSVERIIPCNPQAPDEVRVLVLWTQAAANIEANINNRIALAIAQTNQAYLNSQVGGTLSLVLSASQQINFNETADIQNDVGTLAGRADIQALRNAVQADLVVLLTNGNYGAFGVVQAIGPDFNGAYSITQTDAATGGRFTFAHEVGHLFGARHDNDPNGTIEHGHTFRTGWFLFTKKRYTLLATMPAGRAREQNYSNPDVQIKNKPTGTANANNNAQQHRNTDAIVANFFANAPVTQPMSINILQDNPNVCCTNVTAEAEVVCGTAPFYFNWTISYDGVNWQLLPNSEIINFNTDCDKSILMIELAVTDANGQFQTVRRYYNADCGQTYRTVSNPPVKKEANLGIIQRVFPNPVNSTAQVELNLSSADNLRMDIIDASGNIRKNVFNGTVLKGNRIFTINTDNLKAGPYQIRVITKSGIAYQQLIVIK